MVKTPTALERPTQTFSKRLELRHGSSRSEGHRVGQGFPDACDRVERPALGDADRGPHGEHFARVPTGARNVRLQGTRRGPRARGAVGGGPHHCAQVHRGSVGGPTLEGQWRRRCPARGVAGRRHMPRR
jgi:hypothetical protein